MPPTRLPAHRYAHLSDSNGGIAINVVLTIVIAILVFGFLIFFHELGHFLVAKAMKVKVNEFAIGMGPTLLKKKHGETTYALRAFPIGGFVAMEGENEESDDDRAFNRKPVWRRVLICIAGAFMNILLGVILLCIMNGCFGGQYLASTTVARVDVTFASENKLEVGDEITSINGAPVYVDYDISFNLLRDNDGVVDIGVIRNGQAMTLTGVEFPTTLGEDGKLYIQNIGESFKVYPEEKNFFSVIKHGALQTLSVARLVWASLIDLITGNVGLEQLSGPVGTADVISQAAFMGWDQFLFVVALITVNLGVFNLLPIPALDGGRLVFLIIEAIRRKPLNPKYEGYVNAASFLLLILLMVAVTFNDIVRIATGG